MLRALFGTAVVRRLIASGLLVGSLALTGCGTPPELRDPPGGHLPAPVTSSGTPTAAPGIRTPTPGAALTPTQPPTFDEATAVACQGRPSGEQVIALLRRSSRLLPTGITVTAPAPGPLCAGDWQYTVLQVADREPLQVVSRGPATSLTLVTAGTDVCNIPVRTAAPAGIRTAACETPPPPPATGGYTTPTPAFGA